MNLSGHIRRLRNQFSAAEEGSVAIYFALSLIGIITVIGVGFDYSRSLNLKAALNAAADAAALAVARDPDVNSNNMQQRATDFFNANTQSLPFGYSAQITATELPQSGGVSIDVSAQIDTTLMAIAGINSFEVKAQSEAVYSTNKIELALVLDNTGSMGGSGKIQTLRDASDGLIDLLIPDNAAKENVKIGIVPFDIGVNVGVENGTAPWMHNPNKGSKYNQKNQKWKGCAGPRFAPHDIKDTNPLGQRKIPPIYADLTSCNLSPILPLTSDKTKLHNKVSDMQAVGWTYIPEGLGWGWRVLSPKKPFQEGVAYSNKDWQKILVLMTDGANTVKWSWKNKVPSAQIGTSSSAGNSNTIALCDAIKAKGIIIYTVAFKVNSSSTQQMLEDCATTPGNFFDAQNNAALETAFAKIGGDINNLRLSK